MRPNIDDHDYDVKMRSVTKFLEEGDKVKITLRFRGREMAHQELGMNLLKRVQDDAAEIAKVEAYPAARRSADADGAFAQVGSHMAVRGTTHRPVPLPPQRRRDSIMKLTMSYAVIAVLALCACGEPAPAPTETASPSPDPTAASPTPTDTVTDAALAPPLVPEAEKGEKGARNVLLAWARAVENKRFGEAYAQFGEGGPPEWHERRRIRYPVWSLPQDHGRSVGRADGRGGRIVLTTPRPPP